MAGFGTQPFGAAPFSAGASSTPKTATLVDTFDTTDTAKWDFSAPATVSGGQLRIVPDPGYLGAFTDGQYNLVGSDIFVELVQPPNVGNGSTSIQFIIASAEGNVRFSWENNVLLAQYRIGATATSYVVASAAYNAVNHRWLKISESAGVVTWSTSLDGTTWTPFGTWTRTIPLALSQVQFIAGHWQAEPSPGTAIIDNLNTPPPPSVVPVLVSSSSTASGGAGPTSVNVPKPSDIVAGNLLVAIMFQANAYVTKGITGGGWTEKHQSTYVASGGFFVIWTKTATGSEPANYTMNGAEYLAGAVLQFSSATDIEAWVTNSGTGFRTSPASTATDADRKHIIAFADYIGGTFTTPVGATLRQTARSADNESLYVFEAGEVDTGASPTYTSTPSSGGTLLGLSFLVTPAAGGEPSPVTGTGALTAASPSLSGAGAVSLTGAGALTASSGTLSGAGTAQLTGSGALTAGSPTLSGAGTTRLTGASALTAGTPSLSGTGTVSDPPISGAGSLTAAAPTLTGTGAVRMTGSGALVAGTGTLAGTGALLVAGISALAAASPALSGAGALWLTGAGALVAPEPFLTGDGALGLTGISELVAGSPSLTGAAELIVRPVDTALVAQPGSLSGEGTLHMAGAGELIAQAAILAGDALVYDASITYTVPRSRTVVVGPETRTLVVEPENRTLRVAPSRRTFLPPIA